MDMLQTETENSIIKLFICESSYLTLSSSWQNAQYHFFFFFTPLIIPQSLSWADIPFSVYWYSDILVLSQNEKE